MSSLDEIIAKRKNRCYEDSASSFIEFRPTPHTRRGFALAQLLHYNLEPDPELPPDAIPRERLVLAFSTADVVLFGLRLATLAERLREHKLAAVWPLAERYSNLDPSQPFVTNITIRMLDKSDKPAS
jgi:hypothetical protein